MSVWTGHGGRLGAARAAWPDAPTPWLDLSTGINPCPWDIRAAGPIAWQALPDDRALAALEATAARMFGIPTDCLCAVPGSEMGLRLLATLGLPTPVHYVAPGYRTHGEAFADSKPVPRSAIGAVSGTLLVASPGNPDGRSVARDELAGSGLRIIDEAFADVSDGPSLFVDDGRTIVLRSFGKFFGLAGVRLGFVAAPRNLIARLRGRLGAWPLSAAAITIGTAAYADTGWIAATRARLPLDAAALDCVLRRRGLTPAGQCPLFRLVDTSQAAAIFARLAAAGILVRPFDAPSTWLRFGLPPDPSALDRLDRALAHG